MKAIFVNGLLRVALMAALGLTLSPLALAQHGGGGHGSGGHVGHSGGGHFGGRGHLGGTRFSGRAEHRRLTRHAPFNASWLFGHHHRHRHSGEPFFFGNGLLYGGFDHCKPWNWNCNYDGNDDWNDSYFDFVGQMDSEPSSVPLSSPTTTSAPQSVTLLYLKNGYSVGVTDYWFENDEVHYVTTYGGENVVPLTGIDVLRTINENASRGVPFELRAKQSPHP